MPHTPNLECRHEIDAYTVTARNYLIQTQRTAEQLTTDARLVPPTGDQVIYENSPRPENTEQ